MAKEVDFVEGQIDADRAGAALIDFHSLEVQRIQRQHGQTLVT